MDGGRGGRWVAALAAGCLGLAATGARAAVAGAWETFYDAYNTDAWYVYNDADDKYYFPFWSGTPVNEEYAYFTYAGDYAVSFIADAAVGGGSFTGDYQGQKIAGIACDVFLQDLAALDYVDCALYATGPYGTRYYFSSSYPASGFAGNGWSSLWFAFSHPWYHWTGSAWVQVDAKTFTNIEEIQITFTPKVGTTGGSRVGLDNVTLEPTVVAPKAATAVIAGTPRNFRLAFTPGPGLECRVERLLPAPATGWESVAGQTAIQGPGEHVMLRPITAGTEIFRVGADPHYTMVFTP